MKKIVYLAGPINGCTDEEAWGWRNQAADILTPLFEIRNPMRRDYRGIEAMNVDEIVEGDIRDIAESDIVLVNAWKYSAGTIMENPYAFLMDKAIVVVSSSPNPSPWLVYHADKIYPDVETACRNMLVDFEYGTSSNTRYDRRQVILPMICR